MLSFTRLGVQRIVTSQSNVTRSSAQPGWKPSFIASAGAALRSRLTSVQSGTLPDVSNRSRQYAKGSLALLAGSIVAAFGSRDASSGKRASSDTSPNPSSQAHVPVTATQTWKNGIRYSSHGIKAFNHSASVSGFAKTWTPAFSGDQTDRAPMTLRASWLPFVADTRIDHCEGTSDLLAEASSTRTEKYVPEAGCLPVTDAAEQRRDLDHKSDCGYESGSDSGVASDDEASDSDSAFVEESDQDVGATHYPSDAGNTLSLEDDGFALPPSPSPTHNDIGFWASRNTLPLSVEIENADHPDRFNIDEKEMSAKIDKYGEENEAVDDAEHEIAAIADSHRISVPASNAPAAVRLDEQHQEWEGTLSRLSDEMTAIDVSKDWVLPYRGANHLKLMCVSGAPDRLSEFYDADSIGLAQRLDALQRKSDALTALISECREVEETIRAAKGGGDMTPASLQLLDRYRKLRETWQCTMNAYYGEALNLGKMRLAAEQVQQIAVRYADALWRDSATVASRANTIVRVEDMSEEACSAFCFHYLTNDALDHAVGGLSFHIFTPSPQRGDYPVVQNAPSDLERFSAQWARDRDSLIALRPAFASIPNGEFAYECTRLIGGLTVAVEKARGALVTPQ